MTRLYERVRPHLPALSLAYVVTLTITAVQYARFGTERFLGWDSSNYVYLTRLLDQLGPVTAYEVWRYPHLYPSMLWIVGKVIGDVTLAERVLPIFWLFVLLAAYQGLSWNLSRDPKFSNLTVIFASISINTIRIYADLHRTLMALAISFIVLIFISNQASSLLKPSRMNLVILGLLTIVLATSLEVFAVVASAIVLSTLYRRSWRTFLQTALFCSIPVALLSSSVVALILEYPGGLADIPAQAVSLNPFDALIFGSGSLVTLPLVALGAWCVHGLAKRGTIVAQLVMGWLLILGALLVVASIGIVKFPAIRILYLVPVPLLLAFSLPPAARLAERIHSRRRHESGS